MYCRRHLIYALACTLLHAGMVQASPAAKVSAPTYKVEVVKKLCAQASDQALYTSAFLEANRYLIQGSDGWLYRTRSDLLTDFNSGYSYKELRQLVNILRLHGTRLVLVYPPNRGLMSKDSTPPDQFDFEAALASYKEKIKTLQTTGALVPDFTELIEKQEPRDFYYKRDTHWTPHGAEAAARIVGDAIKKTGLLRPLESFRVINKAAGPIVQTRMSTAMQELCGYSFAPESFMGYSFETENGNEQNALFSDEPQTEIVLLGTSFSAVEPFNFNGFLQRELSYPIPNYAVSGGGEDATWHNYLNNYDFAAQPPKIVVWEMPPYDQLEKPEVFARVIPRLVAGQQEKKLLVDETVSLDTQPSTSSTLLFSDKFHGLKKSEIVLDIDFASDKIKSFAFRVWYSNGKNVKWTMKSPRGVNLEGNYIFSLFGRMLEPEADFLAVDLTEINDHSVAEYLQQSGHNRLAVGVKAWKMDSKKWYVE